MHQGSFFIQETTLSLSRGMRLRNLTLVTRSDEGTIQITEGAQQPCKTSAPHCRKQSSPRILARGCGGGLGVQAGM